MIVFINNVLQIREIITLSNLLKYNENKFKILNVT